MKNTISFIISYAMVPNDLSGFVGLLLHCPPLSLKKVRFWKWINLGMELEKIPTEAFTHVLFAFNWESLGLTADLRLLISVDSLCRPPDRRRRLHTQVQQGYSRPHFRALQGLLVCDLPQESERRGARGCRPSPSARRSSPGCCRFVCDSHMHTMCLF